MTDRREVRRVVDMFTAARLVERYVLGGSGTVTGLSPVGDGGVLVRSRFARLLVVPRSDVALARESWVTAVVEATRPGRRAPGRPASEMFALLTDGTEVHLNDAARVATMAGWLRGGMSPLALAEVLTWYHPWSSAWVGVVRGPDDPEVTVDVPGLAAPVVRRTDRDDVVLTFHSWMRYEGEPGGTELLTVLGWTVVVPPRGPARWWTTDVVRDVPSGRDRPDGASDRGRPDRPDEKEGER